MRELFLTGGPQISEEVVQPNGPISLQIIISIFSVFMCDKNGFNEVLITTPDVVFLFADIPRN